MEFTYKQAEYHALFYRESGRVRFLKIILKLPLLMDNFMCVYSICTMCTVYVQCLQYITVCIVYVWCVYSIALCVQCVCVYSLHTHLEARSQPRLLFLTVLTPLFSEAMLTESEAHQIG